MYDVDFVRIPDDWRSDEAIEKEREGRLQRQLWQDKLNMHTYSFFETRMSACLDIAESFLGEPLLQIVFQDTLEDSEDSDA